jgi:hypothetical protein
VPRAAIQTLEVMSLIGAAGRKRPETAKPAQEQPDLFSRDVENGWRN